MTAPSIQSATDTNIVVTWSALTSPANGNAPIQAYELLWDNGSGTTPSISLVNSLTTSYTVTSANLIAGTTYRFAVKARNIYGSSSSISSVVSAVAIDPPGEVPIPSVTLGTGADATKVLITWSNPTLTHGADVDQFEVQFRTSTGTFVTDTTNCNPASSNS